MFELSPHQTANLGTLAGGAVSNVTARTSGRVTGPAGSVLQGVLMTAGAQDVYSVSGIDT